MKTRFFMTAALGLWAISASAQNKYEMTEDLKRDEVPVAVQQSLQKDLNTPSVDGRWELFYFETTIENSHEVKLTPEFYRYSCKVKGEKREYFFKPNGTIYRSRGEASQKKK